MEDSQKRVSVLIKAFRKVIDEIPSANLIIIGDGSDKAKLIQLSDKLGVSSNISFLGWKTEEELSEYYLKAKCLVLPSKEESYATVITESLFFGLPVIATDLPVYFGRLINNETGLIFKMEDPNELAEKIKNILTNDSLWTKLHNNCKIKAKEIIEDFNYKMNQVLFLLK